jgi:hypothetical protein
LAWLRGALSPRIPHNFSSAYCVALFTQAAPMKKLFFVALVAILYSCAQAQDFEGTVVWKMRADISDPAMRQQMQAAQAQLSSPEIQAKLKEAQTAMNTPEMQAMMAQNPQMRAMIEKSMAAAAPKPGASSDDATGGLFPKSITMKAKGARTFVKIEGGMMPSEILTLGDKGVSYKIDRSAKTYQVLAKPDDASPSAGAFKVTRTSESTKVLGYTCTRYLVEPVGEGDGTTYSVWTTKEIKGLDPKKMSSLQVGRDSGPNFMSQLDGAPLKMEISTHQAKILMEATAIKTEPLPDSTFALPKGFTEER